jgi:hypothetical protein
LSPPTHAALEEHDTSPVAAAMATVPPDTSAPATAPAIAALSVVAFIVALLAVDAGGTILRREIAATLPP